MLKASETVEQDLLANAALQTAIEGKHYWELAPDNTKAPFATYRITQNPAPSKDRPGDYDLEVWCWESNLTKAAQLAELVKTALENAHHRFRGALSGYTDDDKKEGFIKLMFNFKL